ncbi:MAG TPA: homoserine kinase [Anaeromyxobacter sp.]|nr:homoserine kinase [Anaeromyxobacter sp.]
MAVYTVLSPAEIADALARFGLPPPERVVPEPRGYVNTNHHVWAGGARWFLRVAEGKTEADVRFEGEVHAFLARAGFPAPRLVAAADGRPFASAGGRLVMLFAYAPGEELAEDAVTPERCRTVGDRLARLHELSEGFTADRPNPFGPARVASWIAEIRRDAAADAEVARALPLLEDESRRAAALPGAPRGLVHGDLFVDNVLWIGDRPSAVLDWEMACVDAFAWDLGVALCAWAWGDGAFDGARAAALLRGYAARRPLDPGTARALAPYARLAALRFAASRILALRAPDPGRDRAPRKDWRPFRDRLAALAALGDEGLAALAGVGRGADRGPTGPR